MAVVKGCSDSCYDALYLVEAQPAELEPRLAPVPGKGLEGGYVEWKVVGGEQVECVSHPPGLDERPVFPESILNILDCDAIDTGPIVIERRRIGPGPGHHRDRRPPWASQSLMLVCPGGSGTDARN